MKYSDEARAALTEASEGLSYVAYADPGTGGEPWTNGFGHTKDVKPGDTCTRTQADAWVVEDVADAEAAVNRLVTVSLTQHQFDAMVDWTFNCGAENLESSTLLRKLNAGDFAGADTEFARWVRGGGRVLPGLVKRRALEAAWFNVKD